MRADAVLAVLLVLILFAGWFCFYFILFAGLQASGLEDRVTVVDGRVSELRAGDFTFVQPDPAKRPDWVRGLE